MNTDYDTWNYWMACYTDNKKVSFSMARTPLNIKMVEMMKNFITNQPPMDFTPTRMYLGRVLDNKQGRQYYDEENYQPVLTAILRNDKKVVIDVCITELVRANSKAEFQTYQKLYPGGSTFDQLDDLIKTSKK